MTVCRPHVLVVDDDASIREALSFGLAAQYTVHAVATGGEAVALLQTHPIAAIVLDALLGHEHGLDFVEPIRRVSDAPIVVLTGQGSEELAARAVRLHLDDYVRKPAAVQGLLEALARVGVPPATSAVLAERARRHLDAHFAQAVRVGDLARQLGARAGHLRECFRATYGMSLSAYLRRVHMRHAAHLLRTTDRGLKEVATAVGYTSHTRFGRVFRAVHGVTPSEFRRPIPAEPTSTGLLRPE